MEKKTPIRMCAICRERMPQGELVKIVRQKDGTISVEKDKRINGRSVYICSRAECLAKAIKSKLVSRTLGEVDELIYEEIKLAQNKSKN